MDRKHLTYLGGVIVIGGSPLVAFFVSDNEKTDRGRPEEETRSGTGGAKGGDRAKTTPRTSLASVRSRDEW